MFISKAVSSFKPKRKDGGSWTQPVMIRPGQFAIRFDLRLAMEDDKILEAQIETARDILEKQLNVWRRAKSITPKKGRPRPMPRLLLQLRMLDARAQAGTLAQQAALVWGPGTPAKRLVDSLDDAMNVAQKGYLLLAAMGKELPPRK
ncbi:hypothetical protein C9I57_24030 [Trinickia symbiotica]|uniref:Uncharacterized protein n=2 Tax=Trinickia symbiotica TaxID=863227 RepID=A0A2T3XP12_9BURK|nr:hypothetical protein C9I57_24030 [Trinickia symbiotica]